MRLDCKTMLLFVMVAMLSIPANGFSQIASESSVVSESSIQGESSVQSELDVGKDYFSGSKLLANSQASVTPSSVVLQTTYWDSVLPILIDQEYSSCLSLDLKNDFSIWHSRNAFRNFLLSVDQSHLQHLAEPAHTSLVIAKWGKVDAPASHATNCILGTAALTSSLNCDLYELIWTPEGFKLTGYEINDRVGCRISIQREKKIVASRLLAADSADSGSVLKLLGEVEGRPIFVVLSKLKPANLDLGINVEVDTEDFNSSSAPRIGMDDIPNSVQGLVLQDSESLGAGNVNTEIGFIGSLPWK